MELNEASEGIPPIGDVTMVQPLPPPLESYSMAPPQSSLGSKTAASPTLPSLLLDDMPGSSKDSNEAHQPSVSMTSPKGRMASLNSREDSPYPARISLHRAFRMMLSNNSQNSSASQNGADGLSDTSSVESLETAEQPTEATSGPSRNFPSYPRPDLLVPMSSEDMMSLYEDILTSRGQPFELNNQELNILNFRQRMESYLESHDLLGDLDEQDFLESLDFLNVIEFSEDTSAQERSIYPQGEEVREECEICFEVVSLRRRLCCGFPVCDSCMGLYLETEINQGVVKISCISGTCTSYVFRDEILGRLTNASKTKYYQFLVDANKDPKIKTCPRCSHIYNVKEHVSEDHGKFGVLVSCPECQLDWCFECHAPWHKDVKCREYKKGDKLLKMWAKEHHYGHNNAQKCPKCKIYIERKSGCDHMVCSQCSTSFCYRCGGRYCDVKFFGNHNSRYSILGCKYNFNPDRPMLRRTIRGSVFGAKLMGGLVLLGLGIAAVGVLLGTSIIILPALGGYKYHKYRKLRKNLKRQQKLFRVRTQNALMEMHREQAVLERYTEKFQRPQAMSRRSFSEENSSDAVHIGIQTSQSQQVDVTVHNPYHSDVVAKSDPDNSHSSEIRMNIRDEKGTVTVTTAEISHNPATTGDGTEAELVLHVRTTYQKSGQNEEESQRSVAMETKDKNCGNSVEGESSSLDTINEGEARLAQSDDVGAGKNVTDKSVSRTNSGAKNNQAIINHSSCSKKKDSSGSLKRLCSRQSSSFMTESSGTLKKSGTKKPENGSLSRKHKKALCSKPSETGSLNSSVTDTSQSDNIPKAEDGDEETNSEAVNQKDTLNQSGCFLKLFSKNLKTLQNQFDKEKEKQIGPKPHSELKDVELTGCPDIVSCAIAAEKKRKDSDKEEVELSHDVEMEHLIGLVAKETCSTSL